MTSKQTTVTTTSSKYRGNPPTHPVVYSLLSDTEKNLAP